MTDKPNIKKPSHAPMSGFPVDGNILTIGGRSLLDVADEVGRTPFFAYDSSLIKSRVGELRAAFPGDIHLHYAIKANPLQGVVDLLAGEVDGLDVASSGELNIALQSGASPNSISFAGPGKTDKELAAAIRAGITINLESGNELDRIAELGARTVGTPKVAVRVNPDFELKASGMKMGGGPKPFGVDAELVPELLGRMAGMAVEFMGFHIFCGSQNLSEAAIYEAQQKTFALAIRLSAEAPRPPRLLNIGGGLGIPYFPGETRLDLGKIGAGLESLLPDARKAMPDAEFVMELGRFLVGEAGIYVSRVIDKKISRGRTYLITDGGLHHQLAASGNFGQVLRKNYPVAIGNRMTSDEMEEVDIVGCLCTPLDRLGDRMLLPRAEVGDLVVLFQSGAYGRSASPERFLGHPSAVEILL